MSTSSRECNPRIDTYSCKPEDTRALSNSINFTRFDSKITLVPFDNEVHSEICIVFCRFPEEDLFLFSGIMLEYAGLVHRVN